MVTTPAMVLSFPEKSTSCREHRGAQGECTPQNATWPSHPHQAWGMLRVFWERVWAVPHGREHMSLLMIYLSFRAQGEKGTTTAGSTGQRACRGSPGTGGHARLHNTRCQPTFTW